MGQWPIIRIWQVRNVFSSKKSVRCGVRAAGRRASRHERVFRHVKLFDNACSLICRQTWGAERSRITNQLLQRFVPISSPGGIRRGVVNRVRTGFRNVPTMLCSSCLALTMFTLPARAPEPVFSGCRCGPDQRCSRFHMVAAGQELKPRGKGIGPEKDGGRFGGVWAGDRDSFEDLRFPSRSSLLYLKTDSNPSGQVVRLPGGVHPLARPVSRSIFCPVH